MNNRDISNNLELWVVGLLIAFFPLFYVGYTLMGDLHVTTGAPTELKQFLIAAWVAAVSSVGAVSTAVYRKEFFSLRDILVFLISIALAVIGGIAIFNY